MRSESYNRARSDGGDVVLLSFNSHFTSSSDLTHLDCFDNLESNYAFGSLRNMVSKVLNCLKTKFVLVIKMQHNSTISQQMNPIKHVEIRK